MGTVHLAKGSSLPPKDPNKLRLYSMKFCPFVQRVRLVLLAKNLPHDIINVHLKNKPEWIWTLHPEGRVPVLDTGSKIIPESLEICEYLESTYPEPALYPKEDKMKADDKDIIEKFGEHLKVFYRVLFNRKGLSVEEHLSTVLPVLEFYEKELSKRGLFFGGSQPSMVDYMIWPWAERISVIQSIYDVDHVVKTFSFDRLKGWYGLMIEHPVVKPTVLTMEQHRNFGFQLMAGNNIDFDNI